MLKLKNVLIIVLILLIMAVNIFLNFFLCSYWYGIDMSLNDDWVSKRIEDQHLTEWYSEDKNIHFVTDGLGEIFGTVDISGEQIPFKADFKYRDNFMNLYISKDSESEDLFIAQYDIYYKYKEKDKFKAKLRITNYDFPLEEKTFFYKVSENVTEDYINKTFKTGDK